MGPTEQAWPLFQKTAPHKLDGNFSAPLFSSCCKLKNPSSFYCSPYWYGCSPGHSPTNLPSFLLSLLKAQCAEWNTLPKMQGGDAEREEPLPPHADRCGLDPRLSLEKQCGCSVTRLVIYNHY